MKLTKRINLTLTAILLFGGVSLAVAEEMVPNYTKDGAGSVVTDSAGDCVRTPNMNTPDKLVECGYPEKVMVTKELVAAPTAVSMTTTVADVISIDAAVLFGFDKDQLSEDGKAVIDERISAYGGRVERTAETIVVGHTDSTGPEEYNQALSERRAQAVADYLKNKTKIQDPDIEVVGMGEHKPIASNDTREGRALNRRVNIRFEGVITK
jgi:OOP family OmpA-OmpF porin